jgi:hypothetical protein
MFNSPRSFLHTYAAIAGLFVGITVWWLSLYIHTSERAPNPNDEDVAPRHAAPVTTQTVAFVTSRSWYLDKNPNKDGIDGYDVHVHEEQVEIEAEKHNTIWEKLVLMRYHTGTSSATLLPMIATIQDSQNRARAMLMFLSLLRTGDVPPHPFRVPDLIKLPIFPSAAAVLNDSSVVPEPAGRAPLSAADRRTKEATWRVEIESLRNKIVATLNAVTPLASKLDDTELTASIHLALGDNYIKLLEPTKGGAAFDSATVILNRAYQREHSWLAVAWPVCRDNVPPVLLAVLVYVLSLHHDLFKKLSEDFTGRKLLKWRPNAELAAAMGKPLPKTPILLPDSVKATSQR